MSPVEKKRISYFYDGAVGDHSYEPGHPMKPFRIRLTHSLIMDYGLYKKMEVFRAKPANAQEITQFHTDEYINFLYKVTPENMNLFPKELEKYNVGLDSPIFDGLFDFCGISAGGSIEGAARLNRGKCDIAINWAGGLHHAKKGEASGFCYVNDAVLGIIELLRFHKRVLYIDIDVHHGDGVEEAFYTTDRVMTVSFHKYGEFFPGTGDVRDIGVGKGKYHAINIPLRDGIDDASYQSVFEPIITGIMNYYQPEAVVLQCGADSLSGDRLGPFNLSMGGHANCVTFVEKFRLPMLVLGGGGYTIRNVARAWAFETGALLGVEMNQSLPFNEYYSHFGPDFELDVRPSNMENKNSAEYLRKITSEVIDYLRSINSAPSVEIMDVPHDLPGMNDDSDSRLEDLDDDENSDVRNTIYRLDKRVEDQNVFDSDSEDDLAHVAYEIQRKAQADRGRDITHIEEHIDSVKTGGISPLTPMITNSMDSVCPGTQEQWITPDTKSWIDQGRRKLSDEVNDQAKKSGGTVGVD